MVEGRFPGDVYARYQQQVSSYCANFVATMTSPGSGPGYALVHGDCHTNNIMFQYDKVVPQDNTTGACNKGGVYIGPTNNSNISPIL